MRNSRRRILVVGLLVVGLVSIASLAYASHSFTDVPDDHTFHGDIEWMNDSGITIGCNPPANTEYCPEDNTTRGQLAAFFRRAAQSQVFDAGLLDGFDSSDFFKKGEKVGDADTLDGHDSSDFVLQGTSFGDADTLDGLDSTDFYQKGEKVDDADTLDGLDSTDFLQVGDDLGGALAASVYINTATEEWTLAFNNSVVASCDAGDLLIGGGFQAEDVLGLVLNVEDNYPDENAWVVRGTASVLADVTAYAICVSS